MSKRIVLFEGDGIGPEITRAALEILDAVVGDQLDYE